MSGNWLQAIVTVVAIMNPVGTAPIFQNMVSPLPRPAQRRAAMSACIFIAALLIVVAFAGKTILDLFGISIGAFRAAGGIVVGLMGYDMLSGGRSDQHERLADEESIREQVLVPFAMPIVAGPGTITAVITLSVSQPNGPVPWTAMAAIAAGTIVTGFCLISILFVGRYISRSAQRIFTRFMGLILVAMGVQFLIAGVQDAWQTGETQTTSPAAVAPAP